MIDSAPLLLHPIYAPVASYTYVQVSRSRGQTCVQAGHDHVASAVECAFAAYKIGYSCPTCSANAYAYNYIGDPRGCVINNDQGGLYFNMATTSTGTRFDVVCRAGTLGEPALFQCVVPRCVWPHLSTFKLVPWVESHCVTFRLNVPTGRVGLASADICPPVPPTLSLPGVRCAR